MASKKLTYAQKHTTANQATGISSSWLQDNQDLWDILKRPYFFTEQFSNLQYPRQIAMIDTFRNILSGKFKISPEKLQNSLALAAQTHLEDIHYLTCSQYDAGNQYYAMSDDEKKIVRMECYGTIDRRKEHELSICYKFFCQTNQRVKHRLKDYDLQSSPMWRVFNQFASFRSIAPKVQKYLFRNHINPDALKVMTVNDFCDVIYKTFANKNDQYKAIFLEPSYKKRFVMSFMKACGDEFEKHLNSKGYDPRAVHALCRMMKQYGICDTSSVIVTETKYTDKIIKDLQGHKYNLSGAKPGDPISEEFTDLLFDRGQENLILARDENGVPITADGLPQFEVHHKHAVKFAKDGEYLAKVNYEPNLMLVESEMHRAYYHGFDLLVPVAPNNECYYSRINTTIPTMCMIDGFSPETDIFYYDFENTEFYRRQKEDMQNVVNYYDMQAERLNNIPQIAEKYGINYSKNDIKQEKSNLEKLLGVNIQIPEADIQAFENWAEPQKKFRKRNKIPALKKQGNEK